MIWAFTKIVDDENWKNEFYSGEHDIQFKPVEGSDCSEMVRGPKDTFKADYEGIAKVEERIQNGLRLFGTYYQNLWD